MSSSNFDVASYLESAVARKQAANEPNARQIAAAEAFPLAVLFGTLTAVLCTFLYAFVWSFGFMFSIIAVGFAWLIVKAMLTASNGYGGRLYQIVAVVLVYFTINCGKLLLPVWMGYKHGTPLPVPQVLAYVLFGPILRLQTGIYGILSIVVLGYAIRAAWRLGKGTRTA